VSYSFRNDNRLPQARLAVVSYVIVGMIGLLLIGFWKLQVIDSDKYSQWADRNRIRSIPVIAPRGRMLDRDGRVLVDNYPSFSVLLLRDDPNLVLKQLPMIAEGLGVPLNDLADQLDNARELPKFQPIVIKPEATIPADTLVKSAKSRLRTVTASFARAILSAKQGWNASTTIYCRVPMGCAGSSLIAWAKKLIACRRRKPSPANRFS
jgi:penicillin-binding protein 2